MRPTAHDLNDTLPPIMSLKASKEVQETSKKPRKSMNYGAFCLLTSNKVR